MTTTDRERGCFIVDDVPMIEEMHAEAIQKSPTDALDYVRYLIQHFEREGFSVRRIRIERQVSEFHGGTFYGIDVEMTKP